jgi:ribosomal protein L7/L12
MPLFRFEAMDAQGAQVADTIEAADEQGAQRKIQALGYFPTKVERLGSGRSGGLMCSFCDHTNPAGAERCTNCGAWLSQGEHRDAGAKPPVTVVGSGAPDVPPGSLEDRVLALLKQGRKIEAIKVYRTERHCGLKDAKDAVEALGRQHGVKTSGSGCAGVVVALALLGASALLAVRLLP